MSVSINGTEHALCLAGFDGVCAIYGEGDSMICVNLEPDSVRIAFSHSFGKTVPVEESVIFCGGIDIEGFDRVLSTQPRNNDGENMEFFRHLPDMSTDGYFAPPELNVILGSPYGWVGLGLLDLPDSKLCGLRKDMSFLLESCGGNKKAAVYRSPEMIVTFPQDEWDAVGLFRKKLKECGRMTETRSGVVPDWWKYPIICSYGDQVVEDCVGAKIDTEWMKTLVSEAEKNWGMPHMNVVVDDSWQHIQTFTPAADKSRFPDMREFSDWIHKKGHRLILWTQPLFDNVMSGIPLLSKELGMLTDSLPGGKKNDYYKGSYMIDYTHDNARVFLQRVCETLFGDGEGQFNADGVKLDFLDTLRNPAEEHSYAHPERGVGIRELYLFYKMFSEEARKVKKDVLIDCTAGDPRFESFITHLRLHDTHCGVEEKELRARLVSLACPDSLIDSDGALMYTSWLSRHYVNAAIYAVQSNYYTRGYQEHRTWHNKTEYTEEEASQMDLTAKEKLAYGRLFSLPALRPEGHAEKDGESWKLVGDDGRINGISLYGDTVIYYPSHPGEAGYFFTLRDEAVTLPLFGRRIGTISPEPERNFCVPDYARDRVTIHLLPGVVHKWYWDEKADGIEASLNGYCRRN